MSSNSNLEHWIKEQYQILGLDSKGNFIGKKRFKNLLIPKYAATHGSAKGAKGEIRQLVNR